MTAPVQTPPSVMTEAERVAREHLRIFASGDEAAVRANVSLDYINLRSLEEPAATRQPGPEGFKATIRWAHRAFTDMRFEFHQAVVNGDLVALQVSLHGRQHGLFVVHAADDARVLDVFPSHGRSFVAKHTHWITVSNGLVTKHDAVRDDLGMAQQLGWIPPNPVFIARMLLALRRERRNTKNLK
jgi:predicted ester cyclase